MTRIFEDDFEEALAEADKHEAEDIEKACSLIEQDINKDYAPNEWLRIYPEMEGLTGIFAGWILNPEKTAAKIRGRIGGRQMSWFSKDLNAILAQLIQKGMGAKEIWLALPGKTHGQILSIEGGESKIIIDSILDANDKPLHDHSEIGFKAIERRITQIKKRLKPLI